MTRINAGIPPLALTDRHLLAECREIGRVANLVRARLAKGLALAVPAEFSLGRGHVRFFYDKGGYVVKRWDALAHEAHARGFRASVWDRWDGMPREVLNDWDDREAVATVAARIAERVTTQRTEPRIGGAPADRAHYRNYLDHVVKWVTEHGNKYQELHLHPSWYAGMLTNPSSTIFAMP